MKIFLFFLATATTTLLAQGSGSVEPPRSPRVLDFPDLPPFRVTKSVDGVVQSIGERSISIEDAKTRKLLELRLGSEKVPVKGLGARRLSDVPIGATARVNYAADDQTVLNIRLYIPKTGKKEMQ